MVQRVCSYQSINAHPIDQEQVRVTTQVALLLMQKKATGMWQFYLPHVLDEIQEGNSVCVIPTAGGTNDKNQGVATNILNCVHFSVIHLS